MATTKPQDLVEMRATGALQEESSQVTALVERAKTGDAASFGDLMKLYESRIIAIGVQMGLPREDALDACQDAFVKIFRYMGSFHSGRSFYKWVYRIAVHAIYDHLRRSRPAGVISMEDMDVTQKGRLTDTSVRQDGRVESADLARKLLAGLTCLSRQERIVFVLRDLQEMPTAEIGRILRLSQVTVRRHCMSARHKLRNRLLNGRD